MKEEIDSIWNRFFEEELISYQTIETGIGEGDLRETILGNTASGQRYVIKLADNDFTFPEKIEVWSRTAEEYRKLGYYTPKIFKDKEGRFPIVSYKGRSCVAYAEEFAPYAPVEDRLSEQAADAKKPHAQRKPYEIYYKAMWQMTAKIAEKHFNFTEYPSAWCLFRTFCPSDEMDEVTENSLTWNEYADKLPERFHEQTERIYRRWRENKEELKKHYDMLPTSVFQGDLNSTNLLVDGEDRFVGVFDFNLCGKEVVLNYLFRETHHSEFAKELKMLFEVLEIVREHYHFSEEEKSLALSLYRCLIPFGGSKIMRLQDLKNDLPAIQRFFDETEQYQTMDIDFRKHMCSEAR